MSKREIIGEKLKNMNYTHVTNCGKFGESIYWKVENGIQKVIAIEDMYTRDITCRTSIDRIRKISNEFSSLSENNLMVIVIGNYKEVERLKKKNIAFVDIANHTMKVFSCPNFANECNLIREICRYDESCRKKHRALFENNRKGCYPTLIVYLLIILNSILFTKTLITGTDIWGASAQTVLHEGQSYRMFTYMFMHGSVSHLLGNSISLIIIGRNLVKRIGTLDFMTVYIVGGVAAIFASIEWANYWNKGVDIKTVGASGAIFALIGALIMEVLLDKTMINKWHILQYCIYSFIISSLGRNVDKLCHLGGLLSGMLIMFLIRYAEETYVNNVFIKEMKKGLKYRRGKIC